MDAGKLVGNYLRILGFASLICMLVTMLYNNIVTINLSFILLIWAGSELTRHNATARTWIIRFSFLAIVLTIGTCVYIGLMSKENVTLVLFGVLLSNIPIWLFYVTMGGIVILCAVPPFYLIREGASAFGNEQSIEHLGDRTDSPTAVEA